MADNIEHQDKGELVTNCDRLQNDEVVVTTPVESRIMSIREKQIMIDRDLAELVANCDRFNSLKHSTVRSYAFTANWWKESTKVNTLLYV